MVNTKVNCVLHLVSFTIQANIEVSNLHTLKQESQAQELDYSKAAQTVASAAPSAARRNLSTRLSTPMILSTTIALRGLSLESKKVLKK